MVTTFDVGALVWFARIIEWEFPGFSDEKCLEQLYEVQGILEKTGVIEGSIHRFYIVARKKQQTTRYIGGPMATKDILEAFFKAENERGWEVQQQFLHKEIVWQLFDKETRSICGIQDYILTMKKAYEKSNVRFRCQKMQVSADGNRIVAYLINDRGARSLEIFDFKDNLIYREYEFILD